MRFSDDSAAIRHVASHKGHHANGLVDSHKVITAEGTLFCPKMFVRTSPGVVLRSPWFVQIGRDLLQIGWRGCADRPARCADRPGKTLYTAPL